MKKFLGITLMSLIILCGGLLAGCGGGDGSLTLSFSEQKIEMVTTTEKVDYIISVENSGDMEIDFDFGFESTIAKVVDKAQKIGDGQYSISIAPISAGQTNLKITIRGTKTNIEIPVSISEELQSYSAKADLYVVRGGDSLTLNSTCFDFKPADTTQTNLSFTIKEGQNLDGVSWINNTLSVSNDCSLKNINFVAKSEDVQNLSIEFSVRVVSEVPLIGLNISEYSQKLTNKEEFDANSKITLFESGKNVVVGEGNAQRNKAIELVVNDPYNFQKMIAVEYPFAGENANYAIDVIASSGISGDVTGQIPLTGKKEGFTFVVQSVSITKIEQPHILTFRIYQDDFKTMFKDVVVEVFVTSEPKEIRIDGYAKLPLVELYHNSDSVRNFRFAVYPDMTDAYNASDYHYSISFYTSTDGIVVDEKIAYDTTNGISLSDYLQIKYAGIEVNELDFSLDSIEKLSSLLSVKPLKEYSGYFIIRVECLDENNEVVGSVTEEGVTTGGAYNDIAIKIYRGTENFAFGEGYENGIIFLEMGKTDRFNAFTYDEGSTIGELIISPKTIGDLACTIEQDLSSVEPMLIISPIAVGESEFILQTQNGKFLTLKVIVIREIEQSDFAIKIADVNTNSVSWFDMKDDEKYLSETIDAIIIKGANGSVTIKEQIDSFSDTNAYSYSYTLSLYSNDKNIDPNKYFVIEDNKITALDFTYSNGVDLGIFVKVELVIYDASGFKHIEKNYDEKLDFDFQISAVDYVKSLNFRATTSTSTEKTKVVSVYDKNVLSYVNQNLAEVYLYLDLQKSQKLENHANSLTSSWYFGGLNFDQTTNALGSIGYFYKTEYNEETGEALGGETYIGKFVCDINGINITPSFTITFTVVDDTGSVFESSVTIVIDEYIDVDNIYLTTPLDNIYLDSTDENNSVTVNVYVMPTDAMCQDIQVVVETNTSGCISYTQNGGTITFNFVSGGSGIIRIFPVSKMKTNSITDEYGNYYYHIALPFNAADGSLPERALKISSLESLKKIESGKHYFIDTIIDCNGQELYIPEFSNGSIRGTLYADLESASELYKQYYSEDMQLGGISNFVVKNNGAYSGLFGRIGENTRVYNLSISGRFYTGQAWELDQDAKIGLLAGLNEGFIQNVQVSLSNITNLKIKNMSTRQSVNAYFGLVAGQNDGVIEVTNNAKTSTFMAYAVETQNLNLTFESGTRAGDEINPNMVYSVVSYVGGVVGINSAKGAIRSTQTSDVVLGMYGINVYTNMKVQNNISGSSTVSFVGSVAGENKGQVAGLRAMGEVYASDRVSAVGGLVGLYSYNQDAGSQHAGEIENNISRVFVRGEGIVSGLIGNVYRLSDGTVIDTSKIKNNTVQATDDGTRSGFDASLLIRYDSLNSESISDYTIYALAPTKLLAGNTAESYFDRTVLTSVDVSGDKDNYYGDMICKVASADDFVAGVFTKGTQEVVSSTLASVILASYKQSKSLQDQININNTLKTIDLLNLLGIDAKEISISSSALNIISLSNFGEGLGINGTGVVTLTITSSLNYKNSCQIEIGITNYYSSITKYTDKDHIETLTSVSLINSKSTKVYMSAYANTYNYKNTPIELVGNTEITFECQAGMGNVSGEQIVDVSVSGQELYLKAIEAKEDSCSITYYPIYNLNDTIYYAVYSQDVDAYVFMTLKGLADKEVANNKESASIIVGVITGIEAVVIDKASAKAEPSDNITLTIEYDSYNTADVLVPTLYVEGLRYTYSNGHFVASINGNIVNLFSITLNEAELVAENHYKQVCEFKMVENELVYEMFKNKTLTIVFESQITKQKGSVNVSYKPESITSVLINNYSKEDNDEQMIKESKYTLAYDEDYAVNSTKFTTSGDYNLLKVYVYTKLAEFDYVDISMNVGLEGGYLALGEIGDDGKGKISNNSVYTSIGGVVTLRVYRSDIFDTSSIFDETQHVLPITIIYSAPAVLADGTRVPISLDFFKVTDGKAMVCYQTETTVITKNEKRVEFTIYNKESSEITDEEFKSGISQAYRVVKGEDYYLELEVVGYDDDEIVFESSAPNLASVTNNDGVYTLSITNADLEFTSEYIEVVISSYGQKMENNSVLNSRVQKTSIRIYEFLLDEKDLFTDDTLNLRVLSAVDVREQVVSKLSLEYSNYTKKVQEFEESFKTSPHISWIFTSNGISVSLPTTSVIKTATYELNGFTIKPLVVENVAPYTISVNYIITYKFGKPTCEIENKDILIIGTKTFGVSVYLNTNEELPAPIYNYQDFINMQDGEHYRLVSDIEIRGAEFEMLTAKPQSLDGNGYTITIIGDAFGSSISDTSNFAIFESIAEHAVFKNITIKMRGRKTIQIDNTYSSSGVNIGVLAGTNNGIITNCKIVSEEIIYANVIATVSVMENSYFGTLVAVNNGYITNCQIEANISVGGASVGGLVAVNNGKISSSYVKNSRIANTTSSSSNSIVTGGFVCENSGTISMCYVEGRQSTYRIYADFTSNQFGLESKIIYTSSMCGGFVYQNLGNIEDSYANIPIVSSTRCAGFVAVNDGTIIRSISLSKMKQRDTLNYAFVISASTEGVFENCYFVLEPGIINDYTSESNYKLENNGKYVSAIEGVTPLRLDEFNVTKEGNTAFDDFVVSEENNKTAGVWFYVKDQQIESELYNSLITYVTEASEFDYYDLDTQKTKTPEFVAGRLQLVAPNLISTSRQNLRIESEEDIESGNYTYSVDIPVLAVGGRYNPYLITSAEDFEEYANQRTSNLEYFRLLKDIDYTAERIYSSNLADNILVAYFEGNNFSISNYAVNDKTAYLSSGLFSQVGGSVAQMSVLKNVEFVPNYVNLPNTVYVGAIAGSVCNAYVYNVSVESQNVVVAGKNIVGGLFGRTYNQTFIRNVDSNIIVKSSQYSTGLFTDKYDVDRLYNSIKYKETGANRTSVSYAGAIVGYVSGASYIVNPSVGKETKVYGAIAGLGFGAVGSLATISGMSIDLSSYKNEIGAYAFGGIVSGENRGEIKNTSINSDILNKNLFNCKPIVPLAIGGVAGVMFDGTINGVTSTSGYSVIGANFTGKYGEMVDGYSAEVINNPYVVKYVGGLVGYAESAKISNIDICSDKTNGLIVSGGNYVGGLVGYVNASVALTENISIYLTSHKKFINEDGNEIEEMVYSSYVSEASINQISGLTFDDAQSFGLLIGCINPEGVYNLDENAQVDVSNDKIYLYFADYTRLETDVPEKVSLNYVGNNSQKGTSTGLVWKFKNLAGLYNIERKA